MIFEIQNKSTSKTKYKNLIFKYLQHNKKSLLKNKRLKVFNLPPPKTLIIIN